MLRALGCQNVRRFHMNEGHAALLGLELLDERARASQRTAFNRDDVQAVRERCVFTTHTPVPAGHDKFPLDHAARVLGRSDMFSMRDVFCCEGELNMTYLALNLSDFINGVAKRHGEVSRNMLTPHGTHHHYQIDSITNGVHLSTWASPPFVALFDHHIPGWRTDNASLRNALRIPTDEIWKAHQAAKTRTIDEVNLRANTDFDLKTFTIGFARRAAAYKRADLLITEPARLGAIASGAGGLQIIYGGKAHPKDDGGKRAIQQIVQVRDRLGPDVRIAYLENYDWELARFLTSGVDLWINTPLPPMEASGTSGMKAALNGVPSLSVLDGWWIEGCIDGITGWAIDGATNDDSGNRTPLDAASLYHRLEHVVIPLYYNNRDRFIEVMRHAIALNASHFNTQRMVQEYVLKAYFE
jgi:starch phosphorylase